MCSNNIDLAFGEEFRAHISNDSDRLASIKPNPTQSIKRPHAALLTMANVDPEMASLPLDVILERIRVHSGGDIVIKKGGVTANTYLTPPLLLSADPACDTVFDDPSPNSSNDNLVQPPEFPNEFIHSGETHEAAAPYVWRVAWRPTADANILRNMWVRVPKEACEALAGTAMRFQGSFAMVDLEKYFFNLLGGALQYLHMVYHYDTHTSACRVQDTYSQESYRHPRCVMHGRLLGRRVHAHSLAKPLPNSSQLRQPQERAAELQVRRDRMAGLLSPQGRPRCDPTSPHPRVDAPPCHAPSGRQRGIQAADALSDAHPALRMAG